MDLKSPAARTVVERLANRADIVLEGFRPGVAERLVITSYSIHYTKLYEHRALCGERPETGQVQAEFALCGHRDERRERRAMESVEFKVEGLHCEGCVRSVTLV